MRTIKLVKGQNIALNNVATLVIDIEWQSITADFALEAFGIAVDATQKARADSDFLWSGNPALDDQIKRHVSGKRFEIYLSQLSTTMHKFMIVLSAPTANNMDLTQVSKLQGAISNQSGRILARFQLPQHQDETQSIQLLEIYKHKKCWKIRLTGILLKDKLAVFAKRYGFAVPNALEPARDVPPLEGMELISGQNLSLTKHYGHYRQLLWQVRATPALDDIALCCMAINSDDRVKNIEDFIYTNNPRLRGDGVILTNDGYRIIMDNIPLDIVRLQLVVTRIPISKSFANIDYIKTRILSEVTGQTIATHLFEIAKTHYHSAILLDIYRYQSEWRVRAIGQGFTDGIARLGDKYGFTPPAAFATKIRSAITTASTQIPEPIPVVNFVDDQRTIEIQQQRINMGYGGTAFGGLLTLLGFASWPFFVIGGGLAAGSFVFSRTAQKELLIAREETQERMILNIIKHQNYRVTPFDIASNNNMSVAQVTTILDKLCAKGAGNIEITASGAKVYVFTKMRGDIVESPVNW